jgi:hypothetical protein
VYIATKSGYRGDRKFTILKIRKMCPLVLLVKISQKQDRALGSEDREVIVGGVLEHTAEEKVAHLD